MRIDYTIKQEFSGTRYNTILVSKRKFVKQLVFKKFQGIIDFQMHISGLREWIGKANQIILHTHFLRFSLQKSVPLAKPSVPKLKAHALLNRFPN